MHVAVPLSNVEAQVRQSTSYQIESDSINIGGGLASSTSYIQESTVGEQATGLSQSASYQLKAGYQQMHEVYLAMSSPVDVTMIGPIGGISGGTSTGSTTVTVTTDSRAGYQLSINASNDPAMQSGSFTIADYVPVGDPDFSFTVAGGESYFGFSPEGADVVDRFLDNGVDTCNTSTNETAGACWDGLATTPTPIAQGNGSNHPAGADTTIEFMVGIGAGANQEPGTYVATTTLTLLSL